MFENSLVESTSLLQTRSRWPAMVSVALQISIAAALVALPLLHPEVLPLSAPRLTLVTPSPASKPQPPKPRIVHQSSAAPTEAFAMQPARIPAAAFSSDAKSQDQPALAVGVNLAGSTPSPLSALGTLMPASPHVIARPATPTGPLHVSTGVMEGQLLQPIRPQYPSIARLSRSEGTVVVKAIISKTGSIESARVMSGPAMLQAAALDAVRVARYRPFLLNGQPTEVETTISIVFRMGS